MSHKYHAPPMGVAELHKCPILPVCSLYDPVDIVCCNISTAVNESPFDVLSFFLPIVFDI